MSWWQWLQCPSCSGPLEASDGLSADPGYTILVCECTRYPVVAGIPIFTQGVINANGHTTEQIMALLQAGRAQEALRALLMPAVPTSAAMAPRWLQAWPSWRGMTRLKGWMGRSRLQAWTRLTETFLRTLNPHMTACELFEFFFTRPGSDLATYQRYSLGAPRHLVALSLAQLIDHPDQPILDLACGSGLLTRHLLARAGDQPVIGLDQHFVSLYIAQGWIAPEAHYVCCPADVSLPFAPQTFSTAFCANAFQLFAQKASCVRELQRVLDGRGLLILASVRNRLVKPQLYGRDAQRALTPAGYDRLVADWPHRVLRNTDVLSRYLSQLGPTLKGCTDLEGCQDEQWLSVVASPGRDVFQDAGGFDDWPHALGVLALNPLYRDVGRDARGTVYLQHVWPSGWYAQENGDCRRYQPETVVLGAQVLRDIAQGQRTPAVDALLAQGVVVGLPARFR